MRQVSPFIPHNYKDSSLPCSVFVFEIENISGEERSVSITFVMKNGTGCKKDSDRNQKSETFETDAVEGSIIKQCFEGLPCDYLIGVKKTKETLTSKVIRIKSNGPGNALWEDLSDNGILTEKSEDKNQRPGKDICIGVSSMIKLMPQQTGTIETAFVWHSPKVKFPKSQQEHLKYYTKYFENGQEIIEYALEKYPLWEKWISEWQKDVLEDV